MSSFDHMEWHIANGTECKGYPDRPDAIGNCEEYDARAPQEEEEDRTDRRAEAAADSDPRDR